jgi:hypothetical protein
MTNVALRALQSVCFAVQQCQLKVFVSLRVLIAAASANMLHACPSLEGIAVAHKSMSACLYSSTSITCVSAHRSSSAVLSVHVCVVYIVSS